ncbi:hypothetical protein V8E54_002463 [Elaphomyces granulatus]
MARDPRETIVALEKILEISHRRAQKMYTLLYGGPTLDAYRPTELLSDSSMLAIETHASSSSSARGGSPGRTDYTMALHVVYVLADGDRILLHSQEPTDSSSNFQSETSTATLSTLPNVQLLDSVAASNALKTLLKPGPFKSDSFHFGDSLTIQDWEDQWYHAP